ncbi:hypothetical protein FRB99_002985 [Tulasnella sp. 403]|nr:hypothetical protein FRB99_002985 [Tulasnella sp. 403]
MAEINPSDVAYFDIYPPIAIARVGDSQEWYIGPEIPGVEPMPEGGFRDAEHKIKRCAPRFRLYAFNERDEVLGEITHDNENYEIQWSVHIANKKSAWVRFRGQFGRQLRKSDKDKELTDPMEPWILRNRHVQPWGISVSRGATDASVIFQPKDEHGKEIHTYAHCDTRTKLIIDSGLQWITGKNATPVPLKGDFYGSKENPTTVHLGELHTDTAGRLIVVAGDGHAYSLDSTGLPEDQPFLVSAFDNDDWVESMFDGHVRAFVIFKGSGQRMEAKNRATVMSAPPHYAHGLHMPTTLYDVIEDIYERQARKKQGKTYDVGTVNYYEHIDPLFRRVYMNSWTNFRANEGHGPRRADFWLDNVDLSDPDTQNTNTRQQIFDRVRMPVVKLLPEQIPTPQRPLAQVDPANLEARTKEASHYYMPRLGGDAGDMPENRDDANSADRWASLTQLQYERLEKWSQGQFKTGTKPHVYDNFDDIPLKDQPHALRFAALEWTIGAPLYPGIECYWIAEFGEMYDLQQPFRFGEKAAPGNLTRGLSLPWHSDFYMCNTHWWPSTRPDNIVTEEYFNLVKANFQDEPHNLAVNLTQRVRWDDGLVKHPEQGDERYGNSEMVRKWFKLGFISTVDYGAEAARTPIAIEMQRLPGFSRVPEPSYDPVPPPPDPTLYLPTHKS